MRKSNYLTDGIPLLRTLREEIIAIAEEIHQEFGSHSLVLMQGNPDLAKRLAVWSVSQILLVSTLKDGLSLPPLEFVTCKKLLNDFGSSGMVLSEFSGCSNAFSGFFRFNSFNVQDF